MENFKCIICGCTKHYEVNVLDSKESQINNATFYPRTLIQCSTRSYGDGATDIEFKNEPSAFVCSKCGHVELFAEDLVEEIKQDEIKLTSKIQSLKKEIKDIKLELEQNRIALSNLNKQKDKMESLIKSEEISLKELREYNNGKVEMERNINHTSHEIERMNSRLQEIENKLSILDYQLENVDLISDVKINKSNY